MNSLNIVLLKISNLNIVLWIFLPLLWMFFLWVGYKLIKHSIVYKFNGLGLVIGILLTGIFLGALLVYVFNTNRERIKNQDREKQLAAARAEAETNRAEAETNRAEAAKEAAAEAANQKKKNNELYWIASTALLFFLAAIIFILIFIFANHLTGSTAFLILSLSMFFFSLVLFAVWITKK